MGIARIKTWVAEVLTPGDLNTEFDNLANNAAQDGANSDITSLSGLTTPLSIAQGGTAATTAAAARTSLGFPVADTDAIVKGSADPTKLVRFEVDGLTTGTTRVITVPDADFTIAKAGANDNITSMTGLTTAIPFTATTMHGQCRLTKSGSNLLLSPFNGNKLVINGVVYTIPSAGVTLAPTSLTPSTLYYIYAYMNSSTMTLEASATARATDTTTGVEIKNGDATRTLVGLAYCITGPAWADSATQRFVISWFNRLNISTVAGFTTNRTTTSTGLVEINTEIRNEFITWSTESVRAGACGPHTISSAGQNISTAIALDGTSVVSHGITVSTNSYNTVLSLTYTNTTALSEGYHYITLFGAVQSGTGTWAGAAGVGRTELNATIRG